jgi:Ankyrin repeats (3 copies)
LLNGTFDHHGAAAGSCSVFANKDLQELIFEYFGGKQWCVMGAVCKLWQRWYTQACVQRLQQFRSMIKKTNSRVKSSNSDGYRSGSTAYSIMVSSAPLLQMGVDSGLLDLRCRKTQFNAGRHGTEATLALAHTLGMRWSNKVLKGAARSGCASKVQWLLEQHSVRLSTGVADCAAAGGSVAVLQLLQQLGVVFAASTSRQAAESGHLHVLRFLHSAACPIDSHADRAAAKRGDLPMLKLLHSIGHRIVRHTILIPAAESGSVEVMAWLVQHGAELTASLLQLAAIHSHLQLCQYLFEQGCQDCRGH